jgi:maltose alpha-D-glucosyltransferase/alpha-amylase
LIAVRNQHPAFGRGTLELLLPDNPKVLAFVRQMDDDRVLVVANLSRFSQYVELDLTSFEGAVPVELFGHTRFPSIGKLPYLLTLGPHTFYWFLLEQPAGKSITEGKPEEKLARIGVRASWSEIFQGRPKMQFEAALRNWLPAHRWFGGKARNIQAVIITEAVLLAPSDDSPQAKFLVLAQVEYGEGEPETYSIPFGFAAGEEGDRHLAESPQSVVCRLSLRDAKQTGVVFDATHDATFTQSLLDTLLKRRRWKGRRGDLLVSQFPALRENLDGQADALTASSVKGEQSNTSVVYGDKVIMKLFRRLEPGVNPDLEIGRFLAQRRDFTNTPPLLGAIEYRPPSGEPLTLAVANSLVPQSETAWQFALDNLGRYFEQVLTQQVDKWPHSEGLGAKSLWDLAESPRSAAVHDFSTGFSQAAALLGQRTAELHQALAADNQSPEFLPEPFTQLYQRSLYQSSRKAAAQNIHRLRKRLDHLSHRAQQLGRMLLEHEKPLFDQLKAIVSRKITAGRIRCHGDYHLGQVLYTGRDFMIIDFEGEPARSLSERRIKCSPLQDVAGMIRSFHYAAAQGFNHLVATGLPTPDNTEPLKRAGTFWAVSAVGAFLAAYQTAASKASFYPAAREDREVLLNFYLLNKAIYEMGYELNNRPDWVEIPLAAAVYLVTSKS